MDWFCHSITISISLILSFKFWNVVHKLTFYVMLLFHNLILMVLVAFFTFIHWLPYSNFSYSFPNPYKKSMSVIWKRDWKHDVELELEWSITHSMLFFSWDYLIYIRINTPFYLFQFWKVYSKDFFRWVSLFQVSISSQIELLILCHCLIFKLFILHDGFGKFFKMLKFIVPSSYWQYIKENEKNSCSIFHVSEYVISN